MLVVGTSVKGYAIESRLNCWRVVVWVEDIFVYGDDRQEVFVSVDECELSYHDQ